MLQIQLLRSFSLTLEFIWRLTHPFYVSALQDAGGIWGSWLQVKVNVTVTLIYLPFSYIIIRLELWLQWLIKKKKKNLREKKNIMILTPYLRNERSAPTADPSPPPPKKTWYPVVSAFFLANAVQFQMEVPPPPNLVAYSVC